MIGLVQAPPGHDTLSLSMFWAGALMAFTPLLGAAAVLLVWWRRRPTRDPADEAQRPSERAHAHGSETRPR